MDGNEAPPVLDRDVAEPGKRPEMVVGAQRAHADAGIVDQDVEPPEMLRCASGGLRAGVLVGEIERQWQNDAVAMFLPEAVRQRLKALLVAVHQRHAVSVAGERLGHGRAEAAGRAGQQYALREGRVHRGRSP